MDSRSAGSSITRVVTDLFQRHGIAVAVATGLIVRVVLTSVLFDWNAVPVRWDDASYAHYADVLIRTGALESHHFPVGYPLFVAFCLKIGGGSFAWVRAANVVLGAFAIVPVSRIANALYGERAGLVAAWLTALYPPLVFMTGRVMSETLFIALLFLSLHRFIVSDRDGRIGSSIVAGALFALASWVRSNLLPMLPLIQLWLFTRPATALRTRLIAPIACTAVIAAILVLPGFYFLAAKGEFLPFATNAGQTFYGANNPLADGGWIQVEDHPELLRSVPADVRRSASAYSKAQYALGFQWIRNNPGTFVALLPKKFANAWIPGLQSSVTTSGSHTSAFVLFLSFGALLVGAVAGRLTFRPTQRDGILLAVPLTYTFMSLVFYGNPRIGLFCAPILIVYASPLVARYVRFEFRAARANSAALG